MATDVTQCGQVKALVDAAVQTYGRIDVMINNAGVMPHSPLERLKIEDWNRTIDINLKGVLYGIAAALPHMQRQRAGHIVNVSSVAGHKVRPGSAVRRPSMPCWPCLKGCARRSNRTTFAPRWSYPAQCDGTDQQRDRTGHRRERAQDLRDRDSRRFLRACGRFRDQSTGRGRRERNSVPSHASGAVT